LSRDELFAFEPSLRDARLPIEAALQVQGDEAGDCPPLSSSFGSS